MLYFNFVMGSFISALVYLKRPEAAMIGIMSMITFLFMGLVKLYLTTRVARHSIAE